MAQTVAGERYTHTLSLLVVSPASRIAVFFGRSLPATVNGIVVSVWTSRSRRCMFGIHVPAHALAPLALTIAVTAFACVGIGLFNASLGLRWRETAVIGNLLLYMLLIFAGVNVPLSRLPGWMSTLAQGLPVTHGANAARQLIAGAPLGHVAAADRERKRSSARSTSSSGSRRSRCSSSRPGAARRSKSRRRIAESRSLTPPLRFLDSPGDSADATRDERLQGRSRCASGPTAQARRSCSGMRSARAPRVQSSSSSRRGLPRTGSHRSRSTGRVRCVAARRRVRPRVAGDASARNDPRARARPAGADGPLVGRRGRDDARRASPRRGARPGPPRQRPHRLRRPAVRAELARPGDLGVGVARGVHCMARGEPRTVDARAAGRLRRGCLRPRRQGVRLARRGDAPRARRAARPAFTRRGPGSPDVPVLLFLATQPPHVDQNREHLPRFQAAVPHADVRWLDGASHGMIADAGPPLGDQIAEWLATIGDAARTGV